jgi:hypothetical protein
MPFLVIDNTATETIIGVKARNLLRETHNAEGPGRTCLSIRKFTPNLFPNIWCAIS